jgi:hypothetical protein
MNIPFHLPRLGEALHNLGITEPVHIPRTASDAFAFLSVRTAELSAKLRSGDLPGATPKDVTVAADAWAMISEVLGKLAEFTKPFPHANARHVRWAYETLLKRVPESAVETEPLAKWLQRVPACASDKAAPAALLFDYLANCCGMYAASLPQRQGKPNEWFYMKGELALPLSNEQAYALGQQRVFWGAIYRKRLLGVVGILLREICGVEEAPTPAAAPTPQEAEKSAAPFAQALENAAEAVKEPDPRFAAKEVQVAAIVNVDGKMEIIGQTEGAGCAPVETAPPRAIHATHQANSTAPSGDALRCVRCGAEDAALLVVCSFESCHYCEHDYPRPVELHHTNRDCEANQRATARAINPHMRAADVTLAEVEKTASATARERVSLGELGQVDLSASQPVTPFSERLEPAVAVESTPPLSENQAPDHQPEPS